MPFADSLLQSTADSMRESMADSLLEGARST